MALKNMHWKIDMPNLTGKFRVENMHGGNTVLGKI